MAVDGSCMDVAGEAFNAQHFGYPAASRGQAAFTQLRMLGLVECATHAVVAAASAPCGHGEVAMAAELLPPKLAADMLVMADRNFYSLKLWQKACAGRAKLPWRVKVVVANKSVEVRHAAGTAPRTLAQGPRPSHRRCVRQFPFRLCGQ